MKDKKSTGIVTSQAVGSVTPEERDEIKRLYERKNSLKELFRSLLNVPKKELEDSYLYEKLVNDIARTTNEYEKWWSDKGAKYKWKSRSGCSWRINFDTCEIFLVNQSQ